VPNDHARYCPYMGGCRYQNRYPLYPTPENQPKRNPEE
jgi:hypothetical protein